MKRVEWKATQTTHTEKGHIVIVGQLLDWRDHLEGEMWQEAFDFLQSLGPDAEDREVELRGDKMFARVISYDTRSTDTAILESHREYIDVQTALSGPEGIDWYPVNALEVKEPYNDEFDRALYHRYEPAPAHIDNHPGMFVVMYPGDAHMPQLIVGNEPEHITKAVVKVHVSLVG